jgi:hypothetical protein
MDDTWGVFAAELFGAGSAVVRISLPDLTPPFRKRSAIDC